LDRDELLQIVAQIQESQTELDTVEVKAAHRGTPKRLFEPLSAFANSPRGGIIVFGLDEQTHFQTVGVEDAARLQADIASLCYSEMEPALRPDFIVDTFEGKTIVAAELDGVPAFRKPCYYKPAGINGGSYIRVGNSNRRMSEYEIFSCMSNRLQPTFDRKPVLDATIENLDIDALNDWIGRLKKARPKAKYLNQPFEEVLIHRNVIEAVKGVLRPTLAGLLVFGEYPECFLPQLVITFLQFYGTTGTEKTPRGERFLDNQRFEGPILEMVESAVNYVMASMRKSSLIDGVFRRDVPEYPEEAVREAVINAVAHRDYSNYSLGSYIQIRLFADRLEVQSPGGLYGAVTEDSMEYGQSTRNTTLMRFLEDLHIVENRHSGIDQMLSAMRQAKLGPPAFKDRRSSFLVTFRNHTLMSPKAIEWLNQFAAHELNDQQRLALVYMRQEREMTNSDYRRLNRVDALDATRQLRSLVQTGLVHQHGTKRGTYYTMKTFPDASKGPILQAKEKSVLDYVRNHGSISNRECQRLLDLTKLRASRLLTAMNRKQLLSRRGQSRATRYILKED